MRWDKLEPILRSRSLEDLATIAERFGMDAGFENFGYAVRFHNPSGTKQDSFRTFYNYRNEWGRSYEVLRRPDAFHGDARALLSRAGLPALAWNVQGQGSYDMPVSSRIVQLGRRQMRIAGEFRMRGGITAPCWSRGVDWGFITFSTGATGDLRALGSCIPELAYFGHCFQAAVDRLVRGAVALPRLTDREVEVLRWSAVGKTSWEISVILGISERTVNFHLQGAASKLHVKGGRAACARAVALGLIAL